jgi:light-regulated signal transduction histidine kinase (bacteriophytochrome)
MSAVPSAPSESSGCLKPGSNRYDALDAPALRTLVAQRDQQLAEQGAALQAWTHAVSHDLRAPLRHITSFGPLVHELLQEAPGLDAATRQEALEFLATMDQSARRMGRMLDGLLQLARIARAPFTPQTVDLGALVHEVREALAPRCADRTVQWQADGPWPTVQGDPALLRQLLAELIGNALKFTQARSPAQIRVTGECGADGHCTLCVQDNGVGFDPARAQALFGIFQRLHRESEFDGVGCGLAAVRAIAQRHGGTVSAQAAPGAGCTVSVCWSAGML